MAPRVIFLDVDGVLHPFHGNIAASKVTTFHMHCMQLLQKIVQQTDAEIVLSSSWRNFSSTRSKLLANLCEYDLTYTRWIEPDSAAAAGSASSGKLEKILAFVESHSIVDWAVLDDEDLIGLSGISSESLMVQVFNSRFVRTDCMRGLIERDVVLVSKILSD